MVVNPNTIIGSCSNPTHCQYSSSSVNDSTYRYKGCWRCNYFTEGEHFPYLSMKKASKIIGCSELAISRWIDSGALSSETITPIRLTGRKPPIPSKHVFKKEIEKMKDEYDFHARLRHIYELCDEGRHGGDYDYKNNQFKEIMGIISRYFTKINTSKTIAKNSHPFNKKT